MLQSVWKQRWFKSVLIICECRRHFLLETVNFLLYHFHVLRACRKRLYNRLWTWEPNWWFYFSYKLVNFDQVHPSWQHSWLAPAPGIRSSPDLEQWQNTLRQWLAAYRRDTNIHTFSKRRIWVWKGRMCTVFI